MHTHKSVVRVSCFTKDWLNRFAAVTLQPISVLKELPIVRLKTS